MTSVEEISRWIKPPTPEEIRQKEADRDTARKQMWLERLIEAENTDEASRENRPLYFQRYFSVANSHQASQAPQLTGIEEIENILPEQTVSNAQEMERENISDETPRELKNGPEQHMPNVQAIDGKECEPSSPGVIVDEKIPTTEPKKDKLLVFAPTWLKTDSKIGSQFDVQIRASDPPTVPQGDQAEDTRLRVETESIKNIGGGRSTGDEKYLR